MKKILLFSLILILNACTQGKKPQEEQAAILEEVTTPVLELVWASDSVLMTPESVCFDKQRGVLYVSNINLNPWEKDGNGFITKMDLSGNVLELKWIEGLHGPKGMGLSGGSLFIADIDEIVEADAGTGEILQRYKVEGNPDLNDITTGDDGTVYVSGSTSNTIYALKDGEVTEFLAGEEERFNGLLWEKDRLLLITSGTSQFKAIDWDTKAVALISENMGAGDGIISLGDGSYLTSSWSGAIFYVSPDGKAEKILDTEAAGDNTADIDYSAGDNLLFIPTFFDNRVVAYRVVR